MDFYSKYKSPLGYQTGENQIDSYGVDHSVKPVKIRLIAMALTTAGSHCVMR